MDSFKGEVIQFIVMFLMGISLNPMNVMAYRLSDLYISRTLIYSGILMGSNMMWSHQIVHYISIGHFSVKVFFAGIIMSILSIFFLLRNQFLVDDIQWLKRMISHHSTAITTSKKIYDISKSPKIKIFAKDIINIQEKEIQQMKREIKNIKKDKWNNLDHNK